MDESGAHGCEVAFCVRPNSPAILWELEVLNYTRVNDFMGVTLDDAEVDLFGYKPFANGSAPTSMAEAAESMQTASPVETAAAPSPLARAVSQAHRQTAPGGAAATGAGCPTPPVTSRQICPL